MTTIEQKKARIEKLRRLGRDVSVYEAKLMLILPFPSKVEEVVEEPKPVRQPVRRIGRPPRNG
jgi:hypothetical protein